MRVDIASAGPSLLGTWPHRSPGRLTIAVNLALRCVDADYVCAGDWETLQELLKGCFVHRGYCTTRDCARLIAAGEVTLGVRTPLHSDVHVWEDLPVVGPSPRWSGVAALGLAAALGATEIHAYGYDLEGDRDCAGVLDCDRSLRWGEERQLVRFAVRRLAARGIRVCDTLQRLAAV